MVTEQESGEQEPKEPEFNIEPGDLGGLMADVSRAHFIVAMFIVARHTSAGGGVRQECFHQCCEQSAAEARPLSLQAAQEGLQLVVEGKETLECARVLIVIIRSVEECAFLLALVYATAIALCRLGRCAPQVVR